MHRLPEQLLTRAVRVVVVGCGGNGSAIAGGLPYLHQSLLAFGHPHGLEVTLVDGDTVSETNCVRQPFTRSEIGLNKARVLATRLNLFWGLEWKAVAGHLGKARTPHADLVIGCVDTRAARRAILDAYGGRRTYWLDLGNDADAGQFVLGQLGVPPDQETPALPTAASLWPEIVDEAQDKGDGPSCSARQALTRQAPFVNPVLANHALALLARLFRYGTIDWHGGYVNLATGTVRRIPVPEPPAEVEGDASDRVEKSEEAPEPAEAVA